MIFTAERFKNNDRLSRAGDNNPLMKLGERGDPVAIIQRALTDLSKYKFPGSTDSSGNLDGIYGNETKSNVWQFQSDEKLEDKDGIVGRQTLARLDKLLTIAPAPPKPKPAKPPKHPTGSKLDRFINIDKISARRLFPAQIDPFPTRDDSYVRARGSAAVRIGRIVQIRLHTLEGRNSIEDLWNEGREAWWFGTYSKRKFNKVRRTFVGIQNHLTNPKLKVNCRVDFKSYGEALPAIKKIKLGAYWIHPDKKLYVENEEERIQTFIHEAAHISGRINLQEARGIYGKKLSHDLADDSMKATRHADCYGYYALDLAMSLP